MLCFSSIFCVCAKNNKRGRKHSTIAAQTEHNQMYVCVDNLDRSHFHFPMFTNHRPLLAQICKCSASPHYTTVRACYRHKVRVVAATHNVSVLSPAKSVARDLDMIVCAVCMCTIYSFSI